jgi:uncharacterized protein with HEPN domain
MQPEDEERLRHMLDAAREALSFAEGRTRADLDRDRLLELGLVKEIEIIGEAAIGVTDAVRASLPQIPWLDIIGMRHRLVHAYFDINLDVLWKSVQDDLPPLIAALEDILGRDR